MITFQSGFLKVWDSLIVILRLGFFGDPLDLFGCLNLFLFVCCFVVLFCCFRLGWFWLQEFVVAENSFRLLFWRINGCLFRCHLYLSEIWAELYRGRPFFISIIIISIPSLLVDHLLLLLLLFPFPSFLFFHWSEWNHPALRHSSFRSRNYSIMKSNQLLSLFPFCFNKPFIRVFNQPHNLLINLIWSS